jgi:hypothetical protein
MQRRAIITALACLLLFPCAARAVSFDLTEVDPGVWTYTLTYDPLDNYSIFQDSTTITLSGLFGVTGASGPSSTDFTEPLNTINLAWTPQVLGGGTSVTWTHIDSGTGNFGGPMHVFGFQVFAPGAVTGVASLVTDGFSRDITNPLPNGDFELDINTTVDGPTSPAPTTVPEPATIASLAMGLAWLARRRHVSRQ